jgi:hypothetical protein
MTATPSDRWFSFGGSNASRVLEEGALIRGGHSVTTDNSVFVLRSILNSVL